MVARGKRVKRAQPLVNVSGEFPRTPAVCGDSGGCRYRGLRASRLPPATFLAPLRGADRPQNAKLFLRRPSGHPSSNPVIPEAFADLIHRTVDHAFLLRLLE